MTGIRTHVYAFAIAMAAAGSLAITAVAQMQQGGGQMSGGQMPGTQSGGHQHGAMQGTMQGTMPSDQMMANINTMMAGVTSTMRDFTSMQAGTFGPQHDQMTASMRGITDQMHQLHAVMNDVAKNPGLMGNSDAMKAFHQAGSEFQKMGAAFQSMMKNLNQTGKGMPHGAR